MQTTTADKIAVACVLGVALLTAGGWVYALAEKRSVANVMQTIYLRPTPTLGRALAASASADADVARLARAR